MRRFVRVTGRLLVLSAVVGALIRMGRTVLGRPSDTPADGGIRTGSFDAWPPVPVAPGRRRP